MDRCIFLSYRREDTAGYAGRLAVDLRARVEGDTRVIMDVDTFGPGDLFADSIDQALSTCDALIALIGRRWLEADASGHRRIDDPGDWVRVELALALRRRVRVIPVLVDDADLPARSDLPTDLSRLVDHHALELDNATWTVGIERLVRAIVARGGAAFPVLALSTTRVDFGTLALGEPAPRRSVQLLNRGIGQLDAFASSDLPWLGVANRSDAVDLTIDTSRAGELVGQVLVKSAGGTASIEVSAVVAAAPQRRGSTVTDARRPSERGRTPATWVTSGLLVGAVVALLAWAPDMGATVLASRPRLPDDTWPTLVWLLPAPLLVVAAWLVATGRRPGAALGCVGTAMIWVITSLTLVASASPTLDTTSHYVTLNLLVAATTGLVIVSPELRAAVRVNDGHRAAVGLVLLALAVVLRFESGQIGRLLTGVDRGSVPPLDGPTLWQSILMPVILCLPAAVVVCNREQTRALLTLASLQVVYPLVLRLLTFQGTVDSSGLSVATVFLTDLVFVAGSVCIVQAVRAGQRRSAGADRSRLAASPT